MDVMTRRLAPSANVRAVAVDDSLVLVDQRAGQYFGLNETGNQIWELLRQGSVGTEIAVVLAERYDAADSVIVDDTRRILTELVAAGLVI